MRRARWAVLVLAVLVGSGVGLGAFTFVYARGASYLTNDPGACANCHIMTEHYGAWLKSSHHVVAACNDCHTPHNLLGKYATKAANGFWHSFAFTTGRFPDPLRIKPGNRAITERACRDCHSTISEAIDHGLSPHRRNAADRTAMPSVRRQPEPIACTRCHDDVGHWVR